MVILMVVEWWLNGDFDGNLLEMVIYDWCMDDLWMIYRFANLEMVIYYWFMDDLWMIYRFANLEMVIYYWFMDDLPIEHGDL
jgi:hypothetical protein